MPTKKTSINTSLELEKIEKELKETMKQIGINPKPYSIAIRLTAETILERNKAYNLYLAEGGKLINDNGKPNPIVVKLTTWNAQTRACLGMLKLTPARPQPEDSSNESNENPEASESV
jgi:hypothetical protein